MCEQARPREQVEMAQSIATSEPSTANPRRPTYLAKAVSTAPATSVHVNVLATTPETSRVARWNGVAGSDQSDITSGEASGTEDLVGEATGVDLYQTHVVRAHSVVIDDQAME